MTRYITSRSFYSRYLRNNGCICLKFSVYIQIRILIPCDLGCPDDLIHKFMFSTALSGMRQHGDYRLASYQIGEAPCGCICNGCKLL